MAGKTSKQLTILGIVAHPHDITHMCGTLAHHVQDGDRVTAVTMTGGTHIHRQRLYDEMLKPAGQRDLSVLRESEEDYGNCKAVQFRQVCSLFGVKDARILPFLDFPWRLSEEMYQTVAEIILEVRPDLILTHAPRQNNAHGWVTYSRHDSHGDVGIIVNEACAWAAMPDVRNGRQSHAMPSIFYLGVDFPLEQADLFVDIGDQAENRIRAETFFTTQDHTLEFANKRIAIGAGFMGWMSGNSYAEAWVRARPQVARRIDLTDEEIAHRERPSVQHLAEIGRLVTLEE
jgi:LmbE family N-acetylglucosaminyl deacetylase